MCSNVFLDVFKCLSNASIHLSSCLQMFSNAWKRLLTVSSTSSEIASKSLRSPVERRSKISLNYSQNVLLFIRCCLPSHDLHAAHTVQTTEIQEVTITRT